MLVIIWMESFVTIEIEGLADDFTWNIGEYQFLVELCM